MQIQNENCTDWFSPSKERVYMCTTLYKLVAAAAAVGISFPWMEESSPSGTGRAAAAAAAER